MTELRWVVVVGVGGNRVQVVEISFGDESRLGGGDTFGCWVDKRDENVQGGEEKKVRSGYGRRRRKYGAKRIA